jgi:hypothetical protein
VQWRQNGDGATGANCTSQGAAKCASCHSGFWMNSSTTTDTCVACTAIPNASSAVSCANASNSRVTNCSSGYYLVKGPRESTADQCARCTVQTPLPARYTQHGYGVSYREGCARCKVCEEGKYTSNACANGAPTNNTFCKDCTPVQNAKNGVKITCSSSSDSQISGQPGSELCASGYHLVDGASSNKADTCELNVCTCLCAAETGCNGVSKGNAIGTAATGTACPAPGKVACTKCTAPQYTLNSATKECEANACSCSNGTKATGTDCKSQGAVICKECGNGYTLSSDQKCTESQPEPEPEPAGISPTCYNLGRPCCNASASDGERAWAGTPSRTVRYTLC